MMARFILFSLSFLATLYFILFFVSSIREKEWRAVFLSGILVFLFCAGSAIIWSFAPLFIIWILNSVIVIALLVLLLPYGAASSIHIVGDKTRYDERDTMFARARYENGSPQYRDYYARHPERQRADDRIRAMPELLSPGGTAYEPVGAAVAESNFVLTEKLIPFCDGRAAAGKIDLDPSALTKKLKELTLSLGAVDVKTTRLDQDFLYSHIGRRPAAYGKPIHLNHSHVLVFAVEMDFGAMQHAPNMPVVVESSKQYLEAAKIGSAIASYVRSFGYNARAHTDGNYLLPLPAVAHKAGLGEIGRIGYLIHAKYGARLRLGAVTTDMPLLIDPPLSFGVQDFCRVCKKCASFCPAGAISFGEEKEIRGVKKWSTNQEACYQYWRRVGTDCGICMRVCPYSKPANLTHHVIRLMIRHNPIARRVAAWGAILYD